MKNNLLEAFNIKVQNNSKDILTDYEIFPDKNLLDALRTKIIENIIDQNMFAKDTSSEFINSQIDAVLTGYDLTKLERNHIYNLIDDEVNGFGPLTELLKDDNISEIMVNSPQEIYIEIDGHIIKDESVSFINNEHIIRTIQRLIQPLGKTIDAKNPMIDSRLADGSRINAVIPPISPKGPVITIRKFIKNTTTMEDLIRTGSLTPYMARFLEAAIKGKLNILISGGSAAGKTSLLNTLSAFINNEERIITIEDAAELDLKQNHVISLETKYNNYVKEDEYTIRDLVINSLRMRPDRIIVGEVRGKEAFDMLQAMNTGQDGSLTTIHANSPIDALNRLESLVLTSGLDIPLKTVRQYISRAIDLVVHIEKMSDGKRKITNICEVNSLEEDNITLSDIFIFEQKGLTETNQVSGEYTLIEKIPHVYEKMKNRGIDLVDDIFKNSKKNNHKDLPHLKK